jgi:hypothetical protein
VANSSAKGDKTAYKNFLLSQLRKNDYQTVANFNSWLQKRQEATERAKEAQARAEAIKNFEWGKLINREFIQGGVSKIITNIKYIGSDYIDVVLNDGTVKELDKAQILKSFGLVAA